MQTMVKREGASSGPALVEAASPTERLRRRYREVRAMTEHLAAPLSPEDCQVQSMPDASPVKWHLAHTSWFFETLILAGRPGYQTFDPRFGFLFNSYYEALGPRHARPRRSLLTRPGLDEILAYRAHVDAAMLEACADGSLDDAITLALNHEQQHQELILTDIKHAFFQNPLLPAYRPERAAPRAPQAMQWLQHPGGLSLIGHDGNGFGFDNEA